MSWLKNFFGSNKQTEPTAPPGPTAPKTSINYLFPPDRIDSLPTWRFILHFKVPNDFSAVTASQATSRLKALEWKAIAFPIELDTLGVDDRNQTFGIPIEVPEVRRRQPGALSDYESDVWKIYGNVLEFGFGDLYYEALDWHQDA